MNGIELSETKQNKPKLISSACLDFGLMASFVKFLCHAVVLKFQVFCQNYAAASTLILQTHCQSKCKLLFNFLTSKFLCRYFGFVDRNATRTSK